MRTPKPGTITMAESLAYNFSLPLSTNIVGVDNVAQLEEREVRGEFHAAQPGANARAGRTHVAYCGASGALFPAVEPGRLMSCPLPNGSPTSSRDRRSFAELLLNLPVRLD